MHWERTSETYGQSAGALMVFTNPSEDSRLVAAPF